MLNKDVSIYDIQPLLITNKLLLGNFLLMTSPYPKPSRSRWHPSREKNRHINEKYIQQVGFRQCQVAGLSIRCFQPFQSESHYLLSYTWHFEQLFSFSLCQSAKLEVPICTENINMINLHDQIKHMSCPKLEQDLILRK